MAFGDIVRSASSPDSQPTGIGGDANTIWHCDKMSDEVYELSTSDFSVDRSASSPDTDPTGIGGDANTIWHCDTNADKVYELSTSDFSVDRSASSPGPSPYGIGGDANYIWHCDNYFDKVYELSTSDFSVDRSASSPDTDPYGIGGDVYTIWHCDYGPDKVYELDAANVTAPTVSTSAADNIQGSQADLNGSIDNTGGENCDYRGFVWGTSSHGDPGGTAPGSSAYANNWTESGSYGTGSFSHTATGLSAGQTYYFRACAHNSAGWSYGSEQSFTTIAFPTATTSATDKITTGRADGNGSIDDAGGEDNDERGFVYGPSPHGDPGNTAPGSTAYARYVNETGTFSAGSFSLELAGLKSGRIYYVRAYSHNSAGYSYGGEVSFRAQASSRPVAALAGAGV